MLGEHGAMLEQGLCHELGLNSQTHKAGAESERGWAVVESLKDSLGEAPLQPSRAVPSRTPSAARLVSGQRSQLCSRLPRLRYPEVAGVLAFDPSKVRI